MQTSSTYSNDLFDRLCQQHPDLAINVYAMTPGGAVTLEVITPDGAPFTWQAETLELAVAMAFPEAPELVDDGYTADIPTPAEHADEEPDTGSIFD